MSLAQPSFLPPPDEDSEDLTDREVNEAVPTSSRNELAKRIASALKESGSEFSVVKHELRRRSPHLYWRSRLIAHEEPDIVMVFQADWLKNGG